MSTPLEKSEPIPKNFNPASNLSTATENFSTPLKISQPPKNFSSPNKNCSTLTKNFATPIENISNPLKKSQSLKKLLTGNPPSPHILFLIFLSTFFLSLVKKMIF